MNNTYDRRYSILDLNQMMTVSIKIFLTATYPAEYISVETVIWFMKEKWKAYIIFYRSVYSMDSSIYQAENH